MDKQQILSLINQELASGKISREDLLALASGGTAPSAMTSSVHKDDTSSRLINVLYGIGAIIALVGVVILLSQNWEQIGFLGRVLSTLGTAVATYFTAIVLRSPGQRMVSQVLFLLSAFLAPLGVLVLLREAGLSFTTENQLLTALALAVIYLGALWSTRKSILFLIVIGFASWAYWALIIKLLGPSFYDNDFIRWGSMLLGASYLLIGHGYRSFQASLTSATEGEHSSIQNVLYGFGTLAILGAGISVGGLFDLLFIALIFAAFYGSVYLKSRMMLIFGALFLIAHIAKLTSEYFAHSVGWSIALILAGFMIIGVGYGTLYFNKKYFSV